MKKNLSLLIALVWLLLTSHQTMGQPRTYVFHNRSTVSVRIDYNYSDGIVPDNGTTSVDVIPGGKWTQSMSAMYNGSQYNIRVSGFNCQLESNGMKLNSVSMGFCAFCSPAGTYDLVVPGPPAPITDGWTGWQAQDLTIADRGTDPNGIDYIILHTAIQPQDIWIGMKNIQMKIFNTGSCEWSCQTAQQNVDALTEAYVLVYDGVGGFIDRIPHRFPGDPEYFMRQVSNGGPGGFRKWFNPTVRIDAVRWQDIARGVLLFRSRKQ